MALFENFPYTNLHNLNLDWLVAEVMKEKNFFDNELQPMIEQMIQEIVLNMTITYTAASEMLTFNLGEVGGNG